MNGRVPCPACGNRNTERLATSTRRATTGCHECGHEWDEYIGPECPDCGSNNTRRKTKDVAPHRRRVIVCYECGLNR